MARGRSVNITKYRLDDDGRMIVMQNYNLIRKVINDKFSIYHEYMEDMLQEGAVGLIKAAATYNSDKPAQFSTYAYFIIKNEIQKFVSERTDAIRVPISVGLAIYQSRPKDEEEAEINPVKPTPEVLDHYQVSMDMLQAGIRAKATVSMDDSNESGITYREMLSDESEEELFDYDSDERRLFSEFHTYLNNMYPEQFTSNRIFLDFIRKHYIDSIAQTQSIKQLADFYGIMPNDVKDIINVYKLLFYRHLQQFRLEK